MKKPKKKTLQVYVCSSLRPKVVRRVDKMLLALKKEFKAIGVDVSFFRPRGNDLRKRDSIVMKDVNAIESCDELWLVGSYGRDCSWELGYALGLRKEIRIFRDRFNKARLDSDWMYRAGYLFDRGTTIIAQARV